MQSPLSLSRSMRPLGTTLAKDGLSESTGAPPFSHLQAQLWRKGHRQRLAHEHRPLIPSGRTWGGGGGGSGIRGTLVGSLFVRDSYYLGDTPGDPFFS